MTKENLLELKNQEVDEKISEVTKENNNKKSLAGLVGIFFTTLAIVTIPVLPVALATLSMGVSAFVRRNFYSKRKQQAIKNLESIKKHLDKVKDEELDSSLNFKRRDKIKKLRRIQKKYKDKSENLSHLSGFARSLTTIGAIITIINPIFIVFPLIGIVSNASISNKRLNVDQKANETDRRITNLENDLDFIALSGQSAPRALGRTENSEPKKETTRKTVKSKNEELVDSYLDSLESVSSNKTNIYKENQKVK